MSRNCPTLEGGKPRDAYPMRPWDDHPSPHSLGTKSLKCHSHYSPTARLTGVRAHPTSACPCIRTQVLAWEGTRQHVVAPRPSADRPVRPTLPLR